MKSGISQQHPPMGASMKPKGPKNVMPETMSTAPKKVGASVPGIGAKTKNFRDGKY